MKQTYKPTAEDLLWASKLLVGLREGGRWGWPDIGCTFRISHADRTLTLIDGEPPEGAMEKTAAVFEELGYEVE
jgi:hypothetical protein